MVEFATGMSVWSCWLREQDRLARNDYGCLDYCCSIQLSYLAYAWQGRDGFEPPTNVPDNPQSTACEISPAPKDSAVHLNLRVRKG